MATKVTLYLVDGTKVTGLRHYSSIDGTKGGKHVLKHRYYQYWNDKQWHTEYNIEGHLPHMLAEASRKSQDLFGFGTTKPADDNEIEWIPFDRISSSQVMEEGQGG